MSIQSTATLRVEQLERYGKPRADMPEEAFEGQGRIVLSAISRKVGCPHPDELEPVLAQVLHQQLRQALVILHDEDMGAVAHG